jgi:HEAT repeat protein
MTRGQVFDLSPASGALVAALDDPKPEIARAAGNALGYINTRDAQVALALKAGQEATSDEMRVWFLKNLATAAKFGGNQLEPSQIDLVMKLAKSHASNDVRAAAAEALGAMNLMSERVNTFLMEQAR